MLTAWKISIWPVWRKTLCQRHDLISKAVRSGSEVLGIASDFNRSNTLQPRHSQWNRINQSVKQWCLMLPDRGMINPLVRELLEKGDSER